MLRSNCSPLCNSLPHPSAERSPSSNLTYTLPAALLVYFLLVHVDNAALITPLAGTSSLGLLLNSVQLRGLRE